MTFASAPLLWFSCKQTVVQQPKVSPFTTFGNRFIIGYLGYVMNKCSSYDAALLWKAQEDIQVRMVLLGEIVVEYDSLTCDWTHFIQKSQTTRLTDQ